MEGVYSRTRARAEEFAAKWGAPRTYTSLDALCADPVIEAVYVASPNACHEAQAIALLKAGKHVLCEKPIAPDSAALARMARAARETGRVLMEAMMPAHTPAYRAIRAAMAQIAPVRRATLRFCKYSSRIRERTVTATSRSAISDISLAAAPRIEMVSGVLKS